MTPNQLIKLLGALPEQTKEYGHLFIKDLTDDSYYSPIGILEIDPDLENTSIENDPVIIIDWENPHPIESTCVGS